MTTPGIPFQQGLGLGGYHGAWGANQGVYSSPINGTNQSSAANLAAAQHQAIAAASYNSARANNGKPVENSGIKVGEIIGYRMWHIKDGYLTSYSASHAWPPNETMQGNPTVKNDEGIWAFKQKSRALNKMLDSEDAVMGSIKMWGKVIEYTEGYRSEFAKIVSLDAIRPIKQKKLLIQLNETYGLCQS